MPSLIFAAEPSLMFVAKPPAIPLGGWVFGAGPAAAEPVGEISDIAVAGTLPCSGWGA